MSLFWLMDVASKQDKGRLLWPFQIMKKYEGIVFQGFSDQTGAE